MTSGTMNWFNINRNIVLNNSLPSGITLSGRFSLKRLQWPNMNTTNIEIHNFEINWKVPPHSKAINGVLMQNYHLM
jgi:hypothetical protein